MNAPTIAAEPLPASWEADEADADPVVIHTITCERCGRQTRSRT